MIYFLRGVLPWQNLKATNKKDKYEKIMEKKLSTSVESLCKGLPTEFITYLTYCKNMKFDEKPDYLFLKNLFKDLHTRSRFEYDHVYDWNIVAQEKKKYNEKVMEDLKHGEKNIEIGSPQGEEEKEIIKKFMKDN